MSSTKKTPSLIIAVDKETSMKVRELQFEFFIKTDGGRVSQSAIANKAFSKITIADFLPKKES